jgi:hypothetical protein
VCAAANVLQVLLHQLLAAMNLAEHQLHTQVELLVIAKHLHVNGRHAAKFAGAHQGQLASLPMLAQLLTEQAACALFPMRRCLFA